MGSVILPSKLSGVAHQLNNNARLVPVVFGNTALALAGLIFGSSVMGCIYCVRNKSNSKCYVGKTQRTFTIRQKEHIESALGGSDTCKLFYRALRKYGVDNFEWIPLFRSDDLDELNDLERTMIRLFKSIKPSGYNMTEGGDGALGYRHTPEVREAMRNRRGWHHTSETCTLIGSKKKGKTLIFSEEHKINIRKALKGRKKTLEYIRRIADSQRGKKRNPLPEWHRAKLRKPHTREWNAKIGEARRRAWIRYRLVKEFTRYG